MGKTILLVTTAMIAFAANSVLARLALGADAIDAGGYTGVRLLAGGITLAALLAGTGQRLGLREASRDGGRLGAAAALFVYAIAFSYAYLLLGAGTGALILFATVQFTILGWALSRGDRPGTLALVGLGIALAAFVYLVLPGLHAPDPLGALLMVAAGVAWAVYTLIGRGSANPIGDTARNFVLTTPAAGVALVPMLLHGPVSVAGIGWAIASGAVASGLGYAIWYAVLPRLSRVIAGIVQLSVPAIAAIGGILFLGESFTPRLGIASAAIIGGVALAIWARRSGRPSST